MCAAGSSWQDFWYRHNNSFPFVVLRSNWPALLANPNHSWIASEADQLLRNTQFL
jgi:hypothetical protein